MHRTHSLLLVIITLLAPFNSRAQKIVSGQVYDEVSRQPIPFATVRFGETGQGIVATLEGRFDVPPEIAQRITWVEVSSLGYTQRRVHLPLPAAIYLQPSGSALTEVVIKPPFDKIRHILNQAIANKPRNNPDKYDWYRCNVYYKMTADLHFLDSAVNDTAENKQRQELEYNQHVAMSETYSTRTWRRPQQLQEDVHASRFSGFKHPVFTSLVTDFLPFHAYSDYIQLNGIDYHNPVSRGFEQYYFFDLADELLQGRDTVWILSFRPRGNNANQLRGSVYINSGGYAISQIVARANDTMLKLNTRIEQQYTQVPDATGGTRWFPRQLNYVLNFQQGSDDRYIIEIKGNSLIDSVSFNEDKRFKFDKGHTVRVAPRADVRADSVLQVVRPEALDARELRTYKVMDSLGEKIKLDKIMSYLAKLPEGKVPVSMFDIDLKRLISYNSYENLRLGMGLQTNEHLIRWLSVGGWAGYGFGDKAWKYGYFGELYLGRHKEFVLRGGYLSDINDPGRVQLHRDLDKNYLRTYLLQRVDRVEALTASVRKRLGYWNIELGGTQQQITPQYTYGFAYNGSEYTSFRAQEASLSLRYAFAERRAPFFGSYYSMGSSYPIWYGKVTTGTLQSGDMNTKYTQAIAAVAWHKHINRLGYEHILVEGGKLWSEGPLPLSKLFAGNGFRYNSREPLGIYAFGGMLSMYPYAYYTDQFINVIARHDFDRKLYRAERAGSSLSSAPNICLQYGMLYGTLSNKEVHRYVDFSVPDNAYHEAGVLLNNLIRLRSNLYYLTVNIGYFYHVTDQPFDYNNGRAVIGMGVEL